MEPRLSYISPSLNEEALQHAIGKRQVTAACDSSPGIASLELRLI